jgi:type I restriction enzyme S subunit
MSERSGWAQKPLSEVGELIRGRRFTKNDYVEAGLGCIHYSQIYTDFGPVENKPLTFIAEDSRPRMRLAHTGDLVIAATSENVADVGKAVAWLGDDSVAVHDDCYILRHGLNPAYVSYFFTSSLFHAQKIRYLSETKVVRISGADLSLLDASRTRTCVGLVLAAAARPAVAPAPRTRRCHIGTRLPAARRPAAVGTR